MAQLGQVLAYDGSGKNWVAFTAATVGSPYAIFFDLKEADDVALGTDTQCDCIIAGDVNLYGLDTTAQADEQIISALAACHIRAMRGVSAAAV